MKRKVSGSIVTYNNGDIIQECIQSILEHTKNIDFTLYVIDNGSTDETVDIIRRNFEQVKLICNERNTGFGHGHNKVLSQMDSDYHVVINPDITLHSDVISKMCDYLDNHEDVMMITPKILNEDGTQQYLPKYCPSIRYVIISKLKPFRYLRKRYTREMEELSAPTEVEFCTGCFFLMRSRDFKALSGFDDRFFMYCEDADLSRRVRKSGKIIFYPPVSVTHKWKRDNTGNIKGVFRFLSSLLKYFLKWGVEF